jgi:hypothetical protein
MGNTVYNNTLAVKALASTAISTDTASNGSAVDCGLYGNNFRDVLFIICAHTLTDGTYTASVEESDTSGSGYAAVDSSRVLGALPSFTAAEDNTVKSFGVRPTKRYARVVITSATTTSGGTVSAVAVLGHGGNNPVARS